MRRLPNFHLLRAFEAAARLQSFSRAAKELNVTPSAVSHQVKELEEHLRCALFLRVGRTVTLSPDGRRFYESLAPLLEALQSACEAMMELPNADGLNVHSVPSFALKWLAPRLREFLDDHPQISLRLSTGADAVDLIGKSEIDVAIVYGTAIDQPGVISEPLGRERIAPLCTKRMARKIRHFSGELSSLPLIESTLSPVKWRDWCHWNGIAQRPVTRFSMDRAALAISAAVDGLGIALESTTLAEQELKRGDLVELTSPSGAPIERTIHFLCYRETDRSRAPLQLFRQWLLENRTA